MKKVVVVGAGVSGLAAAHFLAPRAEVVVLEAGDRPGGHVRTTRRDGWLVEHGPSSFQGTASALRGLCSTLGVPLVEASPASRARYVVHRKRPVRLPAGPAGLVATSLLPWSAKLRILRETRAPAAPPGVEESVRGFFERRLGPRVAPLVDAFVTGVYAGDPARLSLRHAFPDLHRMEREHGSLLRGLRARPRGEGPPLLAPEHGFGDLVGKLAARVYPECGKRVRRVHAREGGSFTVDAGGESLEADAVVLALPPGEAAPLLDDKPFQAAAGAQGVAPVAVVALGWPAGDFRGKGMGVLAPEASGRTILGALFESLAFPGRAPEGRVLVRALVGGTRHPDRAKLPGKALVEAVRADLTLLGLARGEPGFTFVARAPGGIPQPILGHGALLAEAARLERAHRGLALLGMGYRTVSVARLVEEAQGAAESILTTL